MEKLTHLLGFNKAWAEKMTVEDGDFFLRLSKLQSPKYLWIGCSDSRITPDASIGLLPGELFVHRNIANLVIHTDLNCLSVIQFAVEVLRVEHIIVCGHYDCGGVKAALNNQRLGLIDNWLRHIQDVARKYETVLSATRTAEKRLDKLNEINVVEQVANVGETTILQDAWLKGQNVSIHGWIYYLTDGIFRDLHVTIDDLDGLERLRAKMLTSQMEPLG